MSPWPARGADAVRRYLKEIGRFPVLTAKQEAEIGRRIEAGQLVLRRALAQVPIAGDHLLGVGEKLRRGAIAPEEVIVLQARFALTRERIRQIEVRALRKLRRRGLATRLDVFASS